MTLDRERKQSPEAKASADEKSKRLSEDPQEVAWRGTQTVQWIPASTSISQGHQNTATVQDLLHANKLRSLQRVD